MQRKKAPSPHETRAKSAAASVQCRMPKQTPRRGLLPCGITMLNCAMTDDAKGGIPAGKIVNFVGDSGVGKAQPVSELVLTPHGYVNIGSIAVGDAIFGADGSIQTVDAVFPQGEKEVFAVAFNDRTSVRCCADHLWNLRTQNDKAKNKPFRTHALRELFETPLSYRHGDHNQWIWHIPLCSALLFPALPVTIDAYLLGVLLGDGCLQKQHVSLSLYEADVRFSVERTLREMGLKLTKTNPDATKHDYYVVADTAHENLVLTHLRHLGLSGKNSHEKFIPHNYKYNSVAVRCAILRGLFDTDGFIGKNGKPVFSTTSEVLAEDVCFLVQSLGGTATTTRKSSGYTKDGSFKQCRDSFSIVLKIPQGVSFFSSSKHKARIQTSKVKPYRKIRSIQSVGFEECVCIKTSAHDGLYLTNHCIVTHNTMVAETCLAATANDSRYDDYDLYLDDAEHALEMNMEYLFGKKAAKRIKAPRYGSDGLPINSDTVEQFFANVMGLIKKGRPFIYFLDSLDSLTDTTEYEQASDLVKAADAAGDDVEKMDDIKLSGSYGMAKAKLMSQILRTIKAGLADTGSTVCIISQVRENVGARPGQTTKKRAGGKALEFYCTHVVWFTAIEILKKEVKAGAKKIKEVIGARVEAKVSKNKVNGKKGKTVCFDIYYDMGIDDVTSMLEFLTERGVISKKGAYVNAPVLGYDKSMYMSELVAAVEEDNLEDQLVELVQEAWDEKESALRLGRKPRFE